MSIETREDANKYYELINELIDNYIDKWKIRPSMLKKYLKPDSKRFNSFLLRNNLSEVKGSRVILKDIIEDRADMERDGVIKFESFSLFESQEFKFESMKQCLYKGVEKANINMEKLLADRFDTNLSGIDTENSDRHIFKVDTWDGDKKVIIYQKEDIEIIQNNIFEYLYDELSKNSVKLTDSIKLDLSSLIDKEKFNEKLSTLLKKDELIKVISDLLDYKFDKEVSDYFIWISK